MSGWISVVIAFITLIVTICIPIQIMKFQRYTNLMSTYMSMEFAHAFQSIIEFFYKNCACDVEKIPYEYEKRYKEDFEELKDKNSNKSVDSVLHYQRRLLNDYFLELEMCRESSWLLRQKIKRDWTASEAYVSRILICMNKVVDDNPDIMMDISSIKHQYVPKVKGVSEYLNRLYNELKVEKKWMQVRVIQ